MSVAGGTQAGPPTRRRDASGTSHPQARRKRDLPSRRRDASGTSCPQARRKRDLLLFPVCREDFVGRLEEDVVVEPDGPVADVVEVDADTFFVGEFVAA